MSLQCPRTVAEFRHSYQTHPKEELLQAVAELHVTNIKQMEQRDALRKALEVLILHTKPGKLNAVALHHAHQVLETL